jgi:hypothetical protein
MYWLDVISCSATESFVREYICTNFCTVLHCDLVVLQQLHLAREKKKKSDIRTALFNVQLFVLTSTVSMHILLEFAGLVVKC